MAQEWRRVGEVGACAGARAAVALDDRVYAASEDGLLWRVTPDGASIERIGDGARSRLLAAARGELYAFEESGPLYAVDPGSGALQRLDGDWSAIRAVAGCDDALFASGGALYAVDPSGEGRQIGTEEWNPRILLAGSESLFSLEESGALYRIDIGDGTWEQLDGDWGDVTAGVVLNGVLYLSSIAGWLYAVTRSGEVLPIPCGAPPATRFLLPSPRALYALEQDGSVHALPFA